MADCTPTALLEISDGTTTIDLINNHYGFCLDKWEPKIAQYKRSGVWQDSPLSDGRQLAAKRFENVIETIELKLFDRSQDDFIETVQDLLRLLEKATDYWATDYQDTPVWIKAKSALETNARYAIVKGYRIPELDDIYGQPFFGGMMNRVAMEKFRLVVERGHWLALQPGTGGCVETSGVQSWAYEAEWILNNTLGGGGFLRDMIESPVTGTLIQTDTNQVWRSTDDGDTWVAKASGGGVNGALVAMSNGDFLVRAEDVIRRSQDDGQTWNVVYTFTAAQKFFTPIKGGILLDDNGHLLAPGLNGNIITSEDGGDTWGIRSDISGSIQGLFQISNGFYFATSGVSGTLWRSEDSVNWIFLGFPRLGTTTSFIYETQDNTLLVATGNGVLRSIDNGVTWVLVEQDAVFYIFQTTDKRIWMRNTTAGIGDIWISENDGIDWNSKTISGPAGDIYPVFQAANGDFYITSTDEVFRRKGTTVSLGRTVTCTNEVYFANKHTIGNLTHVKIDDGGVFTDTFPITIFSQVLLPAVPVVNDAVYFGQNTAVDDTGPFDGLVFDLDDVITFTNSYTITWEYWNGAWVTLSVADNTDANGVFRVAGVNSVSWEQPGDWITNTVDSITGYWVRARLSALAGTITAPSQQNRDIYTVVLSYIDIVATQVLGDIPALLQQKLTNRSDADGRGSNAPNLWDNRIITGLRSYDRGNNFQAYLNASDEQNLIGVTVSLGANTTFVDSAVAPTGRRVDYDPAGSTDLIDVVTFTFNPSIARDFYGTFHAFLRGGMHGGVANEIKTALKVVSGSGGVTFTTETKGFQTVTDFELIDYGQITIPVGGILKSTDLGDQSQLIVQVSGTSGIYVPDMHIYDLILIPVDEWAIDSVDFANTSDSIIGNDDGTQKFLDVDSITNPKTNIQSLVKLAGSNQITSIYNLITSSEAILQANKQQRLWFLAAQTSATGTSFSWIAPPYITHSIQLFKNQRYLSLRGSR